jgi:hypothetical protein
MRESNSNSRTGRRPAAGGGDCFAVVLEFELLSRPAPPCKQLRKSALAEETALSSLGRPRRLLRRLRKGRRRIIEDRPKPAFDFRHRHILARGVIHHLIALHLGDAEIIGIGMGDIEA